MNKKIAILSSVLFISLSCSKTQNHTPVCNGTTPAYKGEISSILSTKCNSCHGPNSSDKDYSTYENLQGVISNGDFESEVMTKRSMPEGTTLTNDQLNLIQCWIENGYPE